MEPLVITTTHEFYGPFSLVDDRTVLAHLRGEGSPLGPQLLRDDGPVALPKRFRAMALVAPGLVACEVEVPGRSRSDDWETKPVELALVDADGREQRHGRYLVPRHSDLLALLNDDSLLACVWSVGGKGRVIRARPGAAKVACTLVLEPATGLHSDAMALSPDHSQLVSTHERELFRFEVQTRAIKRIAKGRTSATHYHRPLAFSPDGKWLVDATSDRRFQVWDARTWKVIHTRALDHDVSAAVFVGDTLLLSDLARLSVQDASDWSRPPEEIVVIPWHRNSELAASPSGHSILLCSPRELHIWPLSELLERPRRTTPRPQATPPEDWLEALRGFNRHEWGPGSRTALAHELEKCGKFDGARDAFIQSILYENGGTGSELRLLDVLQRMHDFGAVLWLAERLVARGVTSISIYKARARAYLEAGRVHDSKRDAARAVKLAPRDDYAWYLLGLASQQLDDDVQALRAAKQCTKLMPTWATGWCFLGSCHVRAEQLTPAIAAYRRAVKLVPTDAAAWGELGRCHAARGKWADAIAAYRRALKLEPTDAVTWYNLGHSHAERGKLADAIAAYRHSVKHDAEDGDAWYNLACVYASQGKVRDAVTALQRAIALDATNVESAREDDDFARLKADRKFKELVAPPA